MWDLFVRVVYVRERECEDSRQIEGWSVFVGSSRVSIPWSDACALHVTVMQKVRIGWRQLVFASISRVKPSRNTPAKHSVLLDCNFWYTLFLPTLYIPTLTTNVEECFWEKTLAINPESWVFYTHNSLHKYLWIFLNSYVSISIPLRC